MVSGWAVAYAKGWNAVVRAAAARGETDAKSLRHKVTTLDAMKARFAAEPGFALAADGTRVGDPSGRWEVASTEYGWLLAGKAGAEQLNNTVGEVRDATCVFADGGSTLCVRRDDGWQVTYATFDLDRRASLQTFREDKGKPRPST